MNWEKFSSAAFGPPRPCSITVHNKRADSPITTQNTTVFTVEFTKKLLKKPGVIPLRQKPLGSYFELDAIPPIFDRVIPYDHYSTFSFRKSLAPLHVT